jgi:large subunit ribosomal protein L35
MKKNKLKTHKSTAKRFKITGTGKVTRTHRRYRNSRINRLENRSGNSDLKALELAKPEAKKVKNLLHI